MDNFALVLVPCQATCECQDIWPCCPRRSAPARGDGEGTSRERQENERTQAATANAVRFDYKKLFLRR